MLTRDGQRRCHPKIVPGITRRQRGSLGQPPDQGGEDRPIRPGQMWSRVGAEEHGDLVTQHQQLDVPWRAEPARPDGVMTMSTDRPIV